MNSPSQFVAYRSKNKIDSLTKQFQYLKPNTYDYNSHFPLKQNTKKYSLHKVAARNSYLIDLMFETKFIYLVAININTRYLYVELMNQTININTNSYSKHNVKTTKKFLRCLEKMISNGMTIKYLSGDSEKCFTSKEAQEFYEANNISFIPVERLNKTQYPSFMNSRTKSTKQTTPNHSSLGVIDRVIRTLRDMAFNMKIGVIDPVTMKNIVIQYNNAPHETLSHYAGYEVSPRMVNDDKELENNIVRRICQDNYNIKSCFGFHLDKGTKVKVYNEYDPLIKRRSMIQPGDFEIDTFTNGMYRVKNNIDGSILMIPRTKVHPLY